MRSKSEKDLIKGCIKEIKSFQKELYQRYSGKLLVVCKRYAKQQPEAEDILQEVFIKIFNNITKFQHKGSFEGWIRRIAVNTSIKYYRRIRFQKEILGVEDYQTNFSDPKVMDYLSEQELLKLIENLPEGYKVVFNLFAIEGFSHKEISDLLGIQESTSRSQLVKARKLLQKKINQMQKELV